MELNFDLGIKEYTVKGANGNMVIRFCPTDANFARRAYETFNILEKSIKNGRSISTGIPVMRTHLSLPQK